MSDEIERLLDAGGAQLAVHAAGDRIEVEATAGGRRLAEAGDVERHDAPPVAYEQRRGVCPDRPRRGEPVDEDERIAAPGDVERTSRRRPRQAAARALAGAAQCAGVGTRDARRPASAYTATATIDDAPNSSPAAVAAPTDEPRQRDERRARRRAGAERQEPEQAHRREHPRDLAEAVGNPQTASTSQIRASVSATTAATSPTSRPRRPGAPNTASPRTNGRSANRRGTQRTTAAAAIATPTASGAIHHAPRPVAMPATRTSAVAHSSMTKIGTSAT